MKKTVIVLTKLTLFVFFLYNIGIFKIDWVKIINNSGEPVNIENQIKLDRFIMEKSDAAKLKGENYSPFDYFNDRIEIDKKKRELPGSTQNFNEIQMMVHQVECNVRAKKFTYDQVEEAREIYENWSDPGKGAREKIHKDTKDKTFWLKIKNWFFLIFIPWLILFYLKNLILGLIYLWLRWEREYKTFKIKNPLSFAISIILYPYVIVSLVVKWFKRLGKITSFEAELRSRQEKLFRLFSGDEIAEIKKLAEKLTKKEWQNYLSGLGLEKKHSFASALLATLILSLFSGNIFCLSANNLILNKDVSSRDFCQIIVVNDISPPSSPNLQNDQTGDIFYFVEENPIFILMDWREKISRKIFEIVFLIFLLTKKIEKVPLVDVVYSS